MSTSVTSRPTLRVRLTGFGRDIFIGKDADDKFIFAYASTTRNSYPITVTFVYEEAVTIAGAEGVEGWISPKDAYEDDDIGKYLIDDDGKMKRVEREYHTGHAKTVGGLTSPGDWYDLPATDEGGGPGQHFRGWHSRGNQVTNPDPVLNDFFIDSTYGDFESFHDGTGAGTGWRAYNPFHPSNYWGGPITIGTDSVSIVGSGYYDADTIQHAFNQTDEAGEAFVITSDRRIVISKAVVDALPTHISIQPEVWVQSLTARARPIAEFWGATQDEKLPDTLIDQSLSLSDSLTYGLASIRRLLTRHTSVARTWELLLLPIQV